MGKFCISILLFFCLFLSSFSPINKGYGNIEVESEPLNDDDLITATQWVHFALNELFEYKILDPQLFFEYVHRITVYGDNHANIFTTKENTGASFSSLIVDYPDHRIYEYSISYNNSTYFEWLVPTGCSKPGKNGQPCDKMIGVRVYSIPKQNIQYDFRRDWANRILMKTRNQEPFSFDPDQFRYQEINLLSRDFTTLTLKESDAFFDIHICSHAHDAQYYQKNCNAIASFTGETRLSDNLRYERAIEIGSDFYSRNSKDWVIDEHKKHLFHRRHPRKKGRMLYLDGLYYNAPLARVEAAQMLILHEYIHALGENDHDFVEDIVPQSMLLLRKRKAMQHDNAESPFMYTNPIVSKVEGRVAAEIKTAELEIEPIDY